MDLNTSQKIKCIGHINYKFKLPHKIVLSFRNNTMTLCTSINTLNKVKYQLHGLILKKNNYNFNETALLALFKDTTHHTMITTLLNVFTQTTKGTYLTDIDNTLSVFHKIYNK